MIAETSMQTYLKTDIPELPAHPDPEGKTVNVGHPFKNIDT